MREFKSVVRLIGVMWIAGLAAAVWQHAPSVAAVAASNPKPTNAPAADANVASAGGPRVVYQGTVTRMAPPQGAVQLPMAAAVQSAPATSQVPVVRPDVAPPAPVAQVIAPALPVRVARLDKPTPAPTAASLPHRVDLNTASVAELNGLGGGMIGRAIVAGRPYRSAEDLLAKRVLNRATFAQIKDQIAAQ